GTCEDCPGRPPAPREQRGATHALVEGPGARRPGTGFDLCRTRSFLDEGTTMRRCIGRLAGGSAFLLLALSVPTRADDKLKELPPAGLSMGGGQALGIGLKHLDRFAWVGGFSSALFGRQADLVTDPSAANKKLRLLWLSCGDRDRLMDASKSF